MLKILVCVIALCFTVTAFAATPQALDKEHTRLFELREKTDAQMLIIKGRYQERLIAERELKAKNKELQGKIKEMEDREKELLEKLEAISEYTVQEDTLTGSIDDIPIKGAVVK